LINRTSEALRIENQEEFFQGGLFDDITRRESIITRYLPESMSLYEFEY
jgi:hypothetical protein